ncbi:hypothetical protein CAPTEDRAFT_217220 [Capitella teleta]|uniref:CTCK domain-containing protein n=1 Tax=Capitella teleta TaxID=283909 RepID=R7TVW3_CAPTE|nr:hypothetical protein CAPTEDRAFT_217220 [Capitella teleta]|eukprot:ELT97824.1 hypothetical protein CAPTEDRAFT_217220 [Capitella teleta]
MSHEKASRSIVFVALLVHSTVSISSISKSAGYHDVHEAIPRMHTRSAPQCEVVPVILNVSPPRRYAAICNSTQVLTFGCQGNCNSYVEMSKKDPQRALRSCRCCEPIKFGVHLATMRCQGNRMLRAPLKFAIECNCRPCFSLKTDLSVLRKMIDGQRSKQRMTN